MKLRSEFSQASGTAAAYAPDIDALVLPSGYASEDSERLVVHELGHALTMQAVQPRVELLRRLPPEIAVHVARYGAARDSATLGERVVEAIAEAYVFLVVGRENELPQALLSELLFILGTMDGSAPQLRVRIKDRGRFRD